MRVGRFVFPDRYDFQGVEENVFRLVRTLSDQVDSHNLALNNNLSFGPNFNGQSIRLRMDQDPSTSTDTVEAKIKIDKKQLKGPVMHGLVSRVEFADPTEFFWYRGTWKPVSQEEVLVKVRFSDAFTAPVHVTWLFFGE